MDLKPAKILKRFDCSCNLSAYLKLKLNFYKKRNKHFAPFHKQDKKMFVFPNTKRCSIYIPNGTKICDNLDSFKEKFSNRGNGFARCTQDIIKRGVYNKKNPSYEPRTYDYDVQLQMTSMAIEYLENMPHIKEENLQRRKKSIHCEFNTHGKLALDIGCGRGISISPLIEKGYTCVGVDLDLYSLSSFKIYQNYVSWIQCLSLKQSNKSKKHNVSSTVPADVVRCDIRHGLPFRDNMFHTVISISFLQWLFYGNVHNQLDTFYSSLSRILCQNGVAVIQFYPLNQKQLAFAVLYAMHYFKGALIRDYPHINRGRKLFLLLHNL